VVDYDGFAVRSLVSSVSFATSPHPGRRTLCLLETSSVDKIFSIEFVKLCVSLDRRWSTSLVTWLATLMVFRFEVWYAREGNYDTDSVLTTSYIASCIVVRRNRWIGHGHTPYDNLMTSSSIRKQSRSLIRGIKLRGDPYSASQLDTFYALEYAHDIVVPVAAFLAVNRVVASVRSHSQWGKTPDTLSCFAGRETGLLRILNLISMSTNGYVTSASEKRIASSSHLRLASSRL